MCQLSYPKKFQEFYVVFLIVKISFKDISDHILSISSDYSKFIGVYPNSHLMKLGTKIICIWSIW